MRRKGWFIVAGICGMTAILLVGLGLVFLASRAYQRLTAPRTLGGPVAIVKGDPPKHGFLGIDFVAPAAPLTVRQVFEGSGAARAGLQPGDVIVSAGSG
jgi:S1-C subfamily serine protease